MPHQPDLRIDDPAGLAVAGAPAWACENLRRAFQDRQSSAGLPIRLVADGTGAPVECPDAPEAFAIWRSEEAISVWGHDARGLVYALTELADRARHAEGDDPFAGPFPLVERPSARIRSIARLFCSESEDLGWFHDRDGWRDYLTMLATNRFNRFSLTLGMGYNYPYHNAWIRDVYFYFPYPFLLAIDGHDVRVPELPDEERDRNLETLRFIGREAARRGLDFQLALWTQRYDFDDVPNANYTVEGVTKANLAPYCRAAITRLLAEVPEITGLTFRVHVEGGIAEGEYGFWEAAFAGVADAGRPIEIDMHGKGLDHTTLELARRSGMPFTASPKYMAEHMGLAYHQSSIREKEYPPEQARSEREQLSEGSRKFLRYSYGDLLRKDKDYSVLYRIWAGTQRILLWGDPALAGGYGRLSMFAGSDGVEWCEPLSFKGRMGTGVPGQRFNYQQEGLAPRRDWEKYLYQYRVWGRGLYAPDGPADGWQRHLRRHCGDAAEACEKGLASASRVLPLVSLTHGPSASNNHYWPEVYSNLALIDGMGRLNYTFDMPAPVRFGNAPTFDSELFATAREWVEKLLAGQSEHRYTPLDVADWLTDLARSCEQALVSAKDARDYLRPETQRILIDVEICAGLARFFAERYRAAVWAELFVATKASALFDRVLDHARRSTMAWDRIADLSRDVYHDDLTYGPQGWLRGSWQSRQAEMRNELLDLQSLRGGGRTESLALSPEAERAAAAIEARRPVTAAGGLEVPETFLRGEDLTIRYSGPSDAAPVLRYRVVDQSKRWRADPMRADGNGYIAVIPGDYLDTPFHLQLFANATVSGAPVLVPGLAGDLANQPYHVVMQA
ncbi:hypothetical protein [Rubellimicrobium roseum]|uniref:Uncharacterized protein n=1 Tax=Rubellimicrobium roseum TaxID=687525 RepID=A0A5C4NCX4_9RHOB|nr:hypothetical protein [Rubellimicrobium roseum]TNC65521.1 hypothetical protein FHG71_17465 [Rubellimicrobium roseum]